MEKQEQKKLQVFLTLKEHEALMKICQVKDRTITGQIRAWIKSQNSSLNSTING